MKVISTYENPEPIWCPTCMAHLTGLTHIGDGLRIPEPGDRTICAYCGTMIIYLHAGVRAATYDEEIEAAMDPRMQFARDLANRARLERRR